MTKTTHTKLRLLAACLLWIGVWQVASLVVGSDLLLASPVQTCARLVAILCDPDTLGIVWFSLSRIGAGFLLAFVLAVGLGLAAHRHPTLRTLVAPAVTACKSIPVACIVVLLLIWVGSNMVSGLAVFLMAFPALYLATLEGFDQADDATEEMLKSFEVSSPRRVCAHTWPRVLPYVVAASKNACGMAWKAGVAAELIGTPRGSMGERVYQAKILLETADLFAWTVLIVVCSFACERLFVWLLKQTGPAARRLALSRVRPRPATTNNPARVRMADVTLGYESHTVTDHLDLEVAEGSRVVFADSSGSGKSTLLHTIAGLVPPLSGTVDTPGTLAMVFQDTRLIEELDAVDNVTLASTKAITRDEARALLMELLPAEALNRPVSELSGGQRRRVEIVRALAHPSSCVILDEPFASLDEATHAQAAAFVLQHLAGRTLLVASHAPEDVSLLDASVIEIAKQPSDCESV